MNTFFVMGLAPLTRAACRTVLVLLLGATGATLLAGCAATRRDIPPVAELLHDSAFPPPGQALRADDVFALSPPMRQYLEESVRPAARRFGRQRGLFGALYAKQQLQLEYDSQRTRTASEAFEARAGNCLSLAIMTGTFARELGIGVRYQMVDVGSSWERSGDLLVHSGHVNVSLGAPVGGAQMAWGGDWLTIDFIPFPNIDRARVDVIDEKRVVAMYLNNRAAETLAEGRIDEAYWWAREAVLHDNAYADAFNTLGVVYRRHGELSWAEAALRRTLALQADNTHATGNLASLLTSQGRAVEAAVWQARLKQLQPAAPFELYEQAQRALAAGEFAQARDLLLKELPRSNGYHGVHRALAQAYVGLGDHHEAARHLSLARENSTSRKQQALYAAKLAHLKTGAAAH